MDIARWGLGLDGLANAVVSYGGRVGYEADAGDTPNTQVVMHDYGDKTSDLRSPRAGDRRLPQETPARVGVIFEGADGARWWCRLTTRRSSSTRQ